MQRVFHTTNMKTFDNQIGSDPNIEVQNLNAIKETEILDIQLKKSIQSYVRKSKLVIANANAKNIPDFSGTKNCREIIHL